MEKPRILVTFIGLIILNALGMCMIYLGQMLGYGFQPALSPQIPASKRKAYLLQSLFEIDAILIVELLILQTCMYLINQAGLADYRYKKQILITITTIQVIWALTNLFNFTIGYYNAQILSGTD
jgi:hypothetical protein